MINKPFTMAEYEASRAKPNNCIFCNSDDIEISVAESGINNTSEWWLSCGQCYAKGSDVATRQEAIAAWNKPGDLLRKQGEVNASVCEELLANGLRIKG